MKKRKATLYVVALIALCAAVILSFAGCAQTINAQYEATGLSWVSQPKSLYYVGDEFDPADAAIQITYNNESSRTVVRNLKDMTDDYTLVNFSTEERALNKEVTLKVGELSLNFIIDVITEDDLKTVTFYPENGETSFTENVVVGKTVSKPVNPVKEGLALLDWVTEDGTPYGFSTTVVEDIKLYARYFANYSFYNEGKLVKSFRVTEGADFNTSEVPALPSKSGYEVAWRYNDTEYPLSELNPLELEKLSLAEAFYKSAAKNMRFDAVYIPYTHRVTVDIMGGQITNDGFFEDENHNKNTILVPYGYTLEQGMTLFDMDFKVLLSVTKQDGESGGYKFAGWYTKDENGDFKDFVDVSNTKIESDTKIYARWQYGVFFYKARVETVIIDKQNVLVVDNAYGLPETILVDEGKPIDETQIPERLKEEYFGYHRWWADSDVGNKPSDVTDFKNEVTTGKITSTVGRPSNKLEYYETFYQIRYTVHFLLGDGGTAIPGVALTISDLRFGAKLNQSQVPGRERISYDKDGAGLDFYSWYLDETRDIPFDYDKNGIDEKFSTLDIVDGTTVGTMNLYADYCAKISWKDDNAVGASSGSLDESITRLSKNNVTIGNLPNLKTIPNYDRGWYYDGNLATPAFDAETGKLNVLKNCELIAKNKAKEYTVTFRALNTDGDAVDVTIENQKVNTAEPMRLPAAYSRWDESEGVQIPGLRDATGIWEIEGYYKDAAFTEKYWFEKMEIDGQTVYVSTETFFGSATVYIRFTRIATEGLSFVSYSGAKDYFVSSAAGLSNLSEIVVPETYRGAAVVGIDESVFANFTKLERIYTPAALKEIRDKAFYGCSTLSVLPKTAKDAKLGQKVYHGTAWYENEWKKEYAVNGKYILLGDISADNTTLYEYLGTKSEVFKVPDGVEIIGSDAFASQDSKITGVELPVSVRIIRTKAFNGMLKNLQSVTSQDASNLEIVESGAFYRLPSLSVLNINGTRFKSIDNVLYQMENGEKNALVTYPSAKDAPEFTDKDGRVKTYYIVEESVASIRENAFAMCNLDVVVFRRGRTTAISATTLQSDFISQFGNTAVFYVPYDLNGEGTPVIKNYYESWKVTFGETRLFPDAFKVEFKSPQAAFTDESGWDSKLWFGFADKLTADADGRGSIYRPKNAESLTLDGMYGGYRNGEFTDKISDGTPVYYDLQVYESWTATLTFIARGVPLATLTVPLGATLDEEQLASIQIPALAGKNSEWFGTFADFSADGESVPQYFGDMSGVAIRYGGEYTVSDTDVIYRIVMNDPYFEDEQYPVFPLTYGMKIPAIEEYVPMRDGLTFDGWYLGRKDRHEFMKSVLLGDGGSVFNEEFVKNYAGAADENKEIPVYLWARWSVAVSFYQTTVDMDGTETPSIQPSFSVSVDYNSDIPAEVRGEPEPFDGFVGTWASYENGKFTNLAESDFQKICENFSVYAHYVRQIVTATFRAEGNEDVVISNVGYGDRITELPTKLTLPKDKVFDDWYYDDGTFTEHFDASRPLYEDTVLYAHFVAVPESADFYKEDENKNGVENAAGLKLEKVNENDVEGNIRFRLSSAKNYKSSVLYLPTTIRGIGADGKDDVLGTLTEISSGAFDGNDKIEHVIIGVGISNINFGAFRNTASLRKITVAEGNQLYKSEDGVLYKTSSPNLVLKYPSAKEGDVYTLPEGVGFGQYSFESPVYLNRIVITGSKPTVATEAFTGMDWAKFKIYVPTAQLNSYCNKGTHTYDADWLREITANYIEKVFQGSTVTVKFVNTLTGEDFKIVADIPLYGSVENPGKIQDPNGYVFGEWCVDKEGLTRYVFGKELSDSLTLYARFVRNRTTGLRYTAIASAGGGVEGLAVSIGSAVDKNVVIPNFYNGYPIIKIAENGFLDADITSLEIPYTLKEFGSGAFVGLGSLTSVSLNELNGRVRSAAFTVADNVLYNKDCTKLLLYPAAYDGRTTFTLPSTVTTVGEYAFYQNKALASVELPASVVKIESSAFAKSNLGKLSLHSAERISLADFNAFSDTHDDFKIFVAHSLLKDYQVSGTSWSYVSSKIYSYTAAIRFYMDFDSTDAIAEKSYETFRFVAEPNYANDGELSVIIKNPPEGKTFRHWTVRETGEVWNFTTNLLLRDVELIANWVNSTREENFLDNTPDQSNYATLSLKMSAGTEWTVLTIPSVYNGKPVREIYANGFTGLKKLTTVVFPASLVRIQKGAFKDCSELRTLEFPESLQSIDESAFENCTALSSVRIPSNMTTISKAIFKNCTSLTNVDFGASKIKTIGAEAFFGCENLIAPSFPSTLQSIGNSAFEGCISIARLTLPEQMTNIGERTFFGNSKLISVLFLGELVKEIGAEAFRNCTALTDILLPNGLLQISANTFYGDRALKTIAIPDSVLFIQDGAFRYCTGLIEATFGVRVERIGNYAFSETALSKLELPASLYAIGDNAFSANSYLAKIYLKGVPSNIGETIFGTSIKLSIFAENDEVYEAYLNFYNFSTLYNSNFMKRWINVTYSYVGADGAECKTSFVAESDKIIKEPKVSELDGFSYPKGGEDYAYRAGYWYTVREVHKVMQDVTWNFSTNTLREDTTLIMRYIVSPTKESESSDGLSFRLLSGDRYEVTGVGSLANKSTIVIPNYYQQKAVVSIASGFLTNLRSKDTVIVIPETVIQIAEDAFRSSEIKRFVIVDNDKNGKFRVEDGALYQIVNEHETRLLRYPSTMTGDFGTYHVKSPSFTYGDKTLKLAYIGEYAFEYNLFSSYSVESGLPFHVFDNVLYEGAEGTASNVLVSYPNLKSLASTEGKGTFTLPSDVNRIYKSALSLTAKSELRKFAVDSGNQVYFADDYGVLYRVDEDAQKGTLCTLVRMPALFITDDTGNYVVGEGLRYHGNPITVTTIAEGAFENVNGITTIVFSSGEEDAVPVLENVNAFKNCSAYFLVDNMRYDDFKAKENWNSIVLYKRYSYITYVTDGAIPQDLADLYLPEDYTGAQNGFIKREQTITQLTELQYVASSSIIGLLRMPYSEIEGWYYDAAFTEKVNFGTNNALIKGDMALYAKWTVNAKASKPAVTEEGVQNEYFSYYPVVENGITISYEIAFRMSSGIAEVTELVIPSYYSPDGTEKNRLPVTGFYDDGTNQTKYNGFSNLETIVLPETFRKFRNIFRVKGDGVVAPKKLKAIVILSKETSYLNPEHVLETTSDDLTSILGFIENKSEYSYYFQDYTTYSAYRQNSVWGGSAGLRGKLLSTVVQFEVTNPTTKETKNSYLRLQSGVETLESYENYGSLVPSFTGYVFEKWEMYEVNVDSEGIATLLPLGDADPATTTFGGKGQPQPNARNGRYVLKAVFKKTAEEV